MRGVCHGWYHSRGGFVRVWVGPGWGLCPPTIFLFCSTYPRGRLLGHNNNRPKKNKNNAKPPPTRPKNLGKPRNNETDVSAKPSTRGQSGGGGPERDNEGGEDATPMALGRCQAQTCDSLPRSGCISARLKRRRLSKCLTFTSGFVFARMAFRAPETKSE